MCEEMWQLSGGAVSGRQDEAAAFLVLTSRESHAAFISCRSDSSCSFNDGNGCASLQLSVYILSYTIVSPSEI